MRVPGSISCLLWAPVLWCRTGWVTSNEKRTRYDPSSHAARPAPLSANSQHPQNLSLRKTRQQLSSNLHGLSTDAFRPGMFYKFRKGGHLQHILPPFSVRCSKLSSGRRAAVELITQEIHCERPAWCRLLLLRYHVLTVRSGPTEWREESQHYGPTPMKCLP